MSRVTSKLIYCDNIQKKNTEWFRAKTSSTLKSVLLTQCISVCCVNPRNNIDYFPIQHSLTGFYNRDGVCLLRGTDWIFICN